ncbi:hypothetical protein ENBRE01_1986 [Enteropsectra breve]|nr:hypothetical protein ENBRE01_1986 [Enteropsectra breve]
MSEFNEQLEEMIIMLNPSDLINWMMEMRLLHRERTCICLETYKLVPYKRNVDGYAWRCMNKNCARYKSYASVRIDSWFASFTLPLRQILKILFKYSIRQTRHSIDRNLSAVRKSIAKVIDNLVETMPETDFSENKLGGSGMIVQIDETMLNHAVKNHHVRYPLNKTDALVIVEHFRRINRVFECVIPNKRAETLIPSILSQVATNSKIYTDEHKSYGRLNELFEEHCTVCHKYEFINRLTGVNTQAVESMNNVIKMEI